MTQDNDEKSDRAAGAPFGTIALVFSILGCAIAFLFLNFLMSRNDPNKWDQALYRAFYSAVSAILCAILGGVCGAISSVRKEVMGSRRRLISIFTAISAIELLIVPVVFILIKHLSR